MTRFSESEKRIKGAAALEEISLDDLEMAKGGAGTSGGWDGSGTGGGGDGSGTGGGGGGDGSGTGGGWDGSGTGGYGGGGTVG